MRKLLILSVLALLTAGAAGCSTGSCGGWRPGYYLFGTGRYPQQPIGVECCDPCGSTPALTAAPCCQ